MGNAKQAKTERAIARQLRPHGRLHDIVEIVGYSFGAHQDCAGATALLVSTAEYLGLSLQPLAVSVFASRPSDDTHRVMGPRATARLSESDLKKLKNYRPGGRDTGHFVAITRDPELLLLDGNLGQLRGFGVAAPDSLLLPITGADNPEAEWEAELPDLHLTYMPDGNDALWERYKNGLKALAMDGQKIAAALERGMSVAQVKTQLRRRG
jgi:hypothetical protein